MNRLATVWAWGFALFSLLFAVAASQTKIPDVLFHHIACFREFKTAGYPSDVQSFTYLTTYNLPNSIGWLSGGVFYTFSIVSGWNTQGLILLKFLSCFAIAIGCHGYAVRRGVSLPVFALLSVLAIILALGFSAAQISPYLLSAVLLVGLLILLNKLDRCCGAIQRAMILAALLVTSAVWSNLQLWGFLSAVLVGFFWLDQVCQNWQDGHSVGQSFKKSGTGLAAWLASGAGLLLNPWGLNFLHALWHQHGISASGQLGMQPIWYLQPVIIQWAFIGSLIVAAFAIWQAPRWPVFESFSLALLALLTIRFTELAGFYIVLWICLLAPLIERSNLSGWLNRQWHSRETTVAIAAVTAGVLLIGLSIQSRFWKPPLWIDQPLAVRQFNQMGYPCEVVQFLKEKQFSGNLLVPPKVGSYIAWELYPQVKVSLDSRPIMSFPASVIEDHTKFYQASSSWEIMLQDPNHQVILVPLDQPVYRPLKRLSENEPRFEWKQIYADPRFALFARVGTEVAQEVSSENVF